MDKELLNEINTAYYRLEMKQAEIIHALSHRIFELESGWYNGHYHKGTIDWRNDPLSNILGRNSGSSQK